MKDKIFLNILNHFFTKEVIEDLSNDLKPKDIYQLAYALERKIGIKRDHILNYAGMPADPFGSENGVPLSFEDASKKLLLNLDVIPDKGWDHRLMPSAVYSMKNFDNRLSSISKTGLVNAIQHGSFNPNHKYFVFCQGILFSKNNWLSLYLEHYPNEANKLIKMFIKNNNFNYLPEIEELIKTKNIIRKKENTFHELVLRESKSQSLSS